MDAGLSKPGGDLGTHIAGMAGWLVAQGKVEGRLPLISGVQIPGLLCPSRLHNPILTSYLNLVVSSVRL